MKEEITPKMFYAQILLMWLQKEERSLSWLARKCAVTPATVYYCSINKNYPSKKHRELIKEATRIEL